MADYKDIAGRIRTTASDGVSVETQEILDISKNKKQSQINAETDAFLADRYTKAETYNKTELNNMITTPNQKYVSVTANSQTTAVTDVLPATGVADTVYRVGNWDGSQFDASVYSEYTWNGSQYVHLSTKTQVGEVFDISAYHATGGELAKYADLEAALGTDGANVPEGIRKGGMSVKFVQSSDNKYVQFRYMGTATTGSPNPFLDTANWQGVDANIVNGSKNLVESGAVYDGLNDAISKTLCSVVGYVSGTHAYKYPIKLSVGKTYYIKHLSGDINNFYTAGADMVSLYNKKWVEFTPSVTGYPYTYISGTLDTAPTIQIAEKSVFDTILKNPQIGYFVCDTAGNVANKFVDAPGFIRMNGGSIKVKMLHKNESVTGVTFSIQGASEHVPLLFEGSPVTNSNTWDDNEIVEIFYDGTNYCAYRISYLSLINDLVSVQELIEYIGIPVSEEAGGVHAGGQKWDDGVGPTTFVRWVIPLAGVKAVCYNVKFTNAFSAVYTFYDGLWGTVKETLASDNSIFTGVFEQSDFPEGATYLVIACLKSYDERSVIAVGNITGDGTVKYNTQQSLTLPQQETARENIGITDLVPTIIYAEREGSLSSNDATHFYGLTAIADALNSITDASPYKRYKIIANGEFRFTDPSTLPMNISPIGTAYAVVIGKNYVDLEGNGPDKTIIAVEFELNQESGFHYEYYQPVYWNAKDATLSNMSIYAKNCRYCVHLEASDDILSHDNAKIYFKNLYLEHKGNDYIGGDGYRSCFGTGIHQNDEWNIENCVLKTQDYDNGYINGIEFGSAFACHNPLGVASESVAGIINFIGCTFYGNLTFSNYMSLFSHQVNLIDCEFVYGCIRNMAYNYSGDASGNVNDNDSQRIRFIVNGKKISCLYANNNLIQNVNTNYIYGGALRIDSLSTGVSSVVRFDKDSTAFDLIVGKSSDGTARVNANYETSQYGVAYRDGGVDLAGYAYGCINVASGTNGSSYVSLGQLLGDCSGTSKTLTVNIDGEDYDIVFNQDMTSESNDNILTLINNVIDGHGVASIYSPIKDYYPNVNGFSVVKSNDDGAILKGMAVVFENTFMRRAKRTDGYIDGICLDDVSKGQKGRVITKGEIFARNGTYNNFKVLQKGTYGWEKQAAIGDKLFISSTEDGVFNWAGTNQYVTVPVPNDAVAVMRCRKKNIWEFI